MTDLDIAQANRVPLPGGWADLRPVCDITERMRRPIKRLTARLTSYPAFLEAIKEAQEKGTAEHLSADDQLKIAASIGDAFDVLQELQDQLVVAAVRGWSWDFAVTPENVLDLPTAALDELHQVVAPYQNALNPNFQPDPDPASPTEPSSA
ncbi:hypothetical protein ACIOUE_01045 [Streptomyces xanthochromogenes]|uniref:hypothetical protein n=1 Tax=Streptomyces xanthochromogenes TaxID=67384 RepID=UPI003810D8BF